MESIYISFFAVPGSHVEELEELRERWGESDPAETAVRYNQHYRRAAEVALYRADRQGKEMASAYPDVVGLLRRQAWHERDQGVFSPEDAQAFARNIMELEHRVGEDALVQDMLKGASKGTTPETLRSVYQACKEALQAAVERGAGFTWAVLREGAEAELEEKRRKWRLAMAESNARPRLTAEERAAALAKLDALKEAGAMALVNRQIKASERQDRRNASRTHIRHARFYLLPKRKMRAVRRLMNKSIARQELETWAESDALHEEARALAAASAVECIALDKLGEARAVADLYAMLCHMTRQAYEESDVYSAAQVKHFLRSLEVWEAAAGERAIQDELATFCRGKQRNMVAYAYHTFKEVLKTVIERDLGLMIDDVFLDE